MSIADKSAGVCAGEKGVGETEYVVSVGSVGEGVVVVCSWVVVVVGGDRGIKVRYPLLDVLGN